MLPQEDPEYFQARVWPATRTPLPHRTVITISADHPARGDAWVVRGTARCGSVAGTDAAIRQQGKTVR